MGDPDVIYLPTVGQPSSLLLRDFRVVFDTGENISMRVGVIKKRCKRLAHDGIRDIR